LLKKKKKKNVRQLVAQWLKWANSKVSRQKRFKYNKLHCASSWKILFDRRQNTGLKSCLFEKYQKKFLTSWPYVTYFPLSEASMSRWPPWPHQIAFNLVCRHSYLSQNNSTRSNTIGGDLGLNLIGLVEIGLRFRTK
jgi:hypothetical protein